MSDTVKQPQGLYLLFMTEMWERFSYYSLRALLILYLTKSMLFDVSRASSWYGSFVFFIYFSPLIGGYIADKWIGRRASIIIGGILIAVGQFVIASGSIAAIYIAMGFIILGNGFFKPNISSILGELYEKNDPRRDRGFTVFYIGINVGAFIAPLVAGYIGEKIGWYYGFATAGIGMIIGLIIFLWGKDKYLVGKGLPPKREIAAVSQEKKPKEPLTKEEKQRISVIFIMAFFSIFFWSLFEQKGAALNILADSTIDRNINFFGSSWEMPATWFQSFNPLFIILLAPLVIKLWIFLASKNKEPGVSGKFSGSFVFMAMAYALLLIASLSLGDGMKMNMMWLIAAYFFFTIGELCISPIALSMVTKLSPLQFTSILMGTWFLGSALAGKFAGVYSGFLSKWSLSEFFMWPVVAALVAAVIIALLSGKIKKWMHGVK